MEDNLKSLSTNLYELIKNSSVENCFSIIKSYLHDIEQIFIQNTFNIPDGLTWFGVSKALSRNDLEGKLVVLDFFTYCCMNCIHILPHLKALEEKYEEDHCMVVIGIHSPKFENEKDVVNLQNAIVKLNITHPVVNDPEAILWNEWDVACWPTLLILGPNGKPIFTLVGEGRQRELNLFVEVALEYYSGVLSKTPLPLCQTTLPVTARLLSFPSQVAVGSNGILAVVDSGHHRVLLFSHSGEIQDVIGGPNAGSRDGNLVESRFRDPQGLVFHGSHKIFVADTGNHAIRLIDFRLRIVTTVVGTGQQGTDLEGGKLGPVQAISSPWGLCIVPGPPIPLVSVHKSPLPASLPLLLPSTLGLSLQSSTSSNCKPPPPPLPQFLPPPIPPDHLPPSQSSSVSSEVKISPDVLLIAMSGSHQIWGYFLEDTVWWKERVYKQGTCAALVGSGAEENRNNHYPRSAGLAQPSGLSYSPENKTVFVADSESSSIRSICMVTGSVTAVVGGHLAPDNLFSFGDKDGVGTSAQLQHPLDVAWDPSASCLFIVDSYNHKLKRVDVSTRECRTIPLQHQLHEPGGICVTEDQIYIADTNAHRLLGIRRDNFLITEVELKLKCSQCGKSKIRRVWETTVPVGPDGSDVTLTVHFGPAFSGRWRIAADNPPALVMAHNSGSVEAGRMQVQFFANTQDEAAVEIDLAECRGDACHMRYYRLLARPVLSSNAPRVTSVSFTPDINR